VLVPVADHDHPGLPAAAAAERAGTVVARHIQLCERHGEARGGAASGELIVVSAASGVARPACRAEVAKQAASAADERGGRGTGTLGG